MPDSVSRIVLTAEDSLALLRSVVSGRVIGSRDGLPDAFPIHYWCIPGGLAFVPSEDQQFELGRRQHIVGVQADGEADGCRWTVMAIGPAVLQPAAADGDRRAWDGSRRAHVVVVTPHLLSGVSVPLDEASSG